MSSVYRFEYHKRVLKQLKKMDKSVQKLIISYIEKNLLYCDDPRKLGKALVGDKRGYWRYRIGPYRLICLIEDDKLLILALELGHRREVYK
uniref:type II toxin-antitoxin system RelE family toxin n=1 Tax=Anaerococcus mediterraneensis TaxID=1870984 RepID=UPI000930FA55|nr:type II toxin-antitoxin system RelE/ParE family toxin [Anaerococcus mediterraneensis]